MFHVRVVCILSFIFMIHPDIIAEPTNSSKSNPAGAGTGCAWRTSEVWRAGNDDSGPIFGIIAGAVRDNKGRTHVLDTQLSIIHTFGPDGEYLSELSCEGEGPGECRQPAGFCLLGPDRLALAHHFPGRLITLNFDGTPTGDIHYTPAEDSSCGFMGLRWVKSTADLFVFGGYCIGAGDKSGKSSKSGKGKKRGHDGSASINFISRCSTDGQELDRYLEQPWTLDRSGQLINEMDFDKIWERAALGPDSRLFLAPERDRYLINAYAMNGSLQFQINRPVDGLPRTPEQLASVKEDLKAWARYFKSPPREIKVCPAEPCITGLWPRPDGELWVRTSRGDHLSAAADALQLDVFDANGIFLHEISIRCQLNPDLDSLQPLGQDHLLVVVGGKEARLDVKGNTMPNESDSVVEIICYRLEIIE